MAGRVPCGGSQPPLVAHSLPVSGVRVADVRAPGRAALSRRSPALPYSLLLSLSLSAGVPHSHVKPHVRAKGRKFEKARGKRASRGYKA